MKILSSIKIGFLNIIAILLCSACTDGSVLLILGGGKDCLIVF